MPSDAPSLATSSAICSALRVDVPSSSIAATKFAMPGLSRGLASLPVRSTRLAATIGRPRRSLRMSVRPFESVADSRRRQLQRTRLPGARNLVAPRLVGVDRFASRLRRRRRGRRGDLRAGLRFARDDVQDDARVRRQLLLRERLQRWCRSPRDTARCPW